ncbi:MAG: hypothetical protein FJ110_15695 [Deltaproteobacteria bacterium]|nr:hypothetical protein [Deltaproteobacteria bacterium]
MLQRKMRSWPPFLPLEKSEKHEGFLMNLSAFYCDGSCLLLISSLELGEGATVQEVVRNLGIPLEKVKMMLLNGKGVDSDSILSNDRLRTPGEDVFTKAGVNLSGGQEDGGKKEIPCWDRCRNYRCHSHDCRYPRPCHWNRIPGIPLQISASGLGGTGYGVDVGTDL